MERLERVCRLLADSRPGYDWVGFYLVTAGSPRELVLGPFVGAPTEHVRIPFGRGVCGQVAVSGCTVVVDDVSREANYLSCGTDVRSEIAVPVFHAGAFVGELDIDSHRPAAFSAEDRSLLERIADRVSALCQEAATAGD
jgi:GAF domain-containing protein